jgi:ribose transport system ATP-binding protein
VRAQQVPALSIHDLSKTFGGQVALSRVDLTVTQGEVHALVGQNGSGKSTLIKVLAGYHRPDPGATATVHGVPLELGSAADASSKHMHFVHQDLGLVLELSVVENLMMTRRYPRGFCGRVKWREARRITADTVARVGLDIDVRGPVAQLGPADRTRLAIARALPEREGEKVILILDEPTASLPAQDVARLLASIRELAKQNHTVVLVSHHVDEVLEIADTITILRDGRNVATAATATIDHKTLVRLILGTDLVPRAQRADAPAETGPTRLLLDRVAGATVRDFTAEIRPGEILGVAGTSGSGRETLAALVTGRLPRTGAVYVDGGAVRPHSPASALAAGIASVSGERARFGIFPVLSVRQNLTMGSLGDHVRLGRIDGRSERREVRQWISDLGIRTNGSEAPITSLSGGNQQKVLVARALRLSPKVLVLEDPTAGIDVGARHQVHQIIERRDEMAVLLTSTDSDELARLCDRVLIMHEGRVNCELRRGADLSVAAIDHAQVTGSVE